MSQANSVPQGGFKQWWLRGDSGLGANIIHDIQVGRWSLDLAEFRDEAPRNEGPAGHFKAFSAALCNTCTEGVKAIYQRVGKPRSLRAAGTIFFGAPARMGTSLPIPPRTRADADIWITIEGWDGKMYQASVPLAKASPATAAWLEKQGGKK